MSLLIRQRVIVNQNYKKVNNKNEGSGEAPRLVPVEGALNPDHSCESRDRAMQSVAYGEEANL